MNQLLRIYHSPQVGVHTGHTYDHTVPLWNVSEDQEEAYVRAHTYHIGAYGRSGQGYGG